MTDDVKAKTKFVYLCMENKKEVSEPAVTYETSNEQGILKLIQSIKNGLKYDFFVSLANNIPFTMAEWSNFLHISERTMQRYKKEEKKFDPIYSERIIEISMLYNFGIEVFGNREKFNTWLENKNIAFGGLIPKELLDTTFGITWIKDELNRIEHGILA